MSVKERVLYAFPFTFVFEGGEIPTSGGAIHDGDFYYFGERKGRVLTVRLDFQAGAYVTFLASDRA